MNALKANTSIQLDLNARELERLQQENERLTQKIMDLHSQVRYERSYNPHVF